MKINKTCVRSGSFAFLAAFVCSCNGEVPRQSAESLFQSGELPPILEAVANPRPDAEKLKDQKPFALRVGVIDEGVDYLHPQLANRIVYTREGEKIVGVGYDVLGNDHWAHPTILDASMMGFGAKLTPDHYRIIEALPDPMKTLNELNQKFTHKLVEKIRADQKLRNTIFGQKIDEKSVHVLGALMLTDPDDIASGRKSFENHAKNKELIRNNKASVDFLVSLMKIDKKLAKTLVKKDNGDFRLLAKEKEIPEPKRNALDQIAKTISYPWTATKDSLGQPIPLPLMSLQDGFDEYLNVLQSAYSEFDRENSFEATYMKPFSDFVIADVSQKNQEKDPKKRIRAQLTDLYSRSLSVATQYDDMDGLEASRSLLCSVVEDQAKLTFTSVQSGSFKNDTFQKLLTNASTDLSDFLDFAALQDESSLVDKVNSRRMKRAIVNYAKLDSEYLNDRDLTAFLCDSQRSVFSDAKTPLYQAYAARHANPYTPGNDFHSHGTHVSGIIASQHPDIGILPIRVMSQDTRTSEAEQKVALDNLMKGFMDWISRDPVALAAVTKELNSYLPEQLSGKAQVLQAIDQIVKEELPMVFNYGEHPLRFYDLFIQHIRKAIRYVGESKLKVVNLSMGIEASRPTAPDVHDRDNDLYGAMEYLVVEYYKTIIAHDLKTSAPHTLFVIASGNSNLAVDGDTQSALPCDLSSPALAKAAIKLGAPKPENNQVDNILCVGSIGAEGSISSFSNDILGRDTPFVLSFGEAIPSSIATGDCEGVAQAIVEKYGPLLKDELPLGDHQADIIKDYLVQRNIVKKDASDQDKQAAYDTFYDKIANEVGLVSELEKAAGKHQCMAGKVSRYMATKSGTSMASPAVAGYVGRFLIERMAKEGVTEDQVYLSDEYSPKSIIAAIFAGSERLGGNSRLSDTPMFRDIRNFGGEPRKLAAETGVGEARNSTSFVMFLK